MPRRWCACCGLLTSAAICGWSRTQLLPMGIALFLPTTDTCGCVRGQPESNCGPTPCPYWPEFAQPSRRRGYATSRSARTARASARKPSESPYDRRIAGLAWDPVAMLEILTLAMSSGWSAPPGGVLCFYPRTYLASLDAPGGRDVGRRPCAAALTAIPRAPLGPTPVSGGRECAVSQLWTVSRASG
jgi:hypothetical protein